MTDTREPNGTGYVPEIGRTILRAVVGSTAHGLSISDQDDVDEQGIYLEPLRQAIFRRPSSVVERTQPEGVPSGPGDVDRVLHPLRKWIQLALNGNPTILLPLFVHDNQIAAIDDDGRELRAAREWFVSKRAGEAALGYLVDQKEKLLDPRGLKRPRRPHYESRYGYDTKYAMHALRLGYQGIELMTEGRIVLPVREPIRSRLLEVRYGNVALGDVVSWIDEIEHELAGVVEIANVPPWGARAEAERWAESVYLAEAARTGRRVAA
jgi:hypothetical protein